MGRGGPGTPKDERYALTLSRSSRKTIDSRGELKKPVLYLEVEGWAAGTLLERGLVVCGSATRFRRK